MIWQDYNLRKSKLGIRNASFLLLFLFFFFFSKSEECCIYILIFSITSIDLSEKFNIGVFHFCTTIKIWGIHSI